MWGEVGGCRVDASGERAKVCPKMSQIIREIIRFYVPLAQFFSYLLQVMPLHKTSGFAAGLRLHFRALRTLPNDFVQLAQTPTDHHYPHVFIGDGSVFAVAFIDVAYVCDSGLKGGLVFP